MCDIVFEKAKGRGGTVNRTSVYGEAAKKFCKIHKKTSVPDSLFWCFIVNFVEFV